MAMGPGPTTGMRSEINVTPLVDVVLVLLIIFMVITPILQVGYPVEVPPKVESFVPPPASDQLIVRMDAAGRMYLNREELGAADFAARLRQALAGGGPRIVFFAAAGELPFEQVADFMDLCRDSGAANLGIVFDDL